MNGGPWRGRHLSFSDLRLAHIQQRNTAMSITPLMPVYPRCGFRPVRGEHCHLIGEDGQRYLDFAAGIAVNLLQLLERKALRIYTGDTIRWTANDHERGLINADRATVTAIDKDGIAVRGANGMEHRLECGDPMLARIDLAYALNAHMAQGLTSDKGIAVMDSRERKLLSGRNFLVTVTRLRDELTLILDNRDKVAVGLERNPGDKTSAIEITERLGTAAAKGQQAGLPKEEAQPKPELERSIERVRPFEIGI